MAVAAYYQWDSIGRPLEPAEYIREFVNRMMTAFPAAAAENLFSWYADEAHYQADYPEDHTPYSYTGWPNPNPLWWVCATDIMDRPDLGVDCSTLFDYWISEAREGRMPWLKYLIWQGLRYDVRNSWGPASSSGHYDHIHISGRTDFIDSGLGTWMPQGPTTEEGNVKQILVQFEDGSVWLCDGMLRRQCTTDELGRIGPPTYVVEGPVGNLQAHQDGLLGNLGNNGKLLGSGGNRDVWGIDVKTFQGGSATVAGEVDLTDESVAEVATATVAKLTDDLAD